MPETRGKLKHMLIFLALLPVLAVGSGASRVVAVFPEVGKAEALIMDAGRMYITEREHIYIYSRDGYKLQTRFGKRGEGPREFMLEPYFQLALGIEGGRIAVYSLGKLSHFSKEGVFIGAKKLKSSRAYDLRPFENFFLGAIQVPGKDAMYNKAVLYDADLNIVKELKQVKGQFRGQGKGTHLLEEQLLFRAYEDKIFITGSAQCLIEVFDKKGKPLYTIKKDVKNVPVPAGYKRKAREFFKTDPRYKDIYGYLAPITCADRFPAIQELFAGHHRLYVLTWQKNKKNNLYGCLVFDTHDGKFIKEIQVPLCFKANMMEPYPFSFDKNIFYQLVDNPETEEWELHAHSF